MQKKQSHNPLIFFYLLVGYIFASFLWWSYLLYNKNEGLCKAQINAAYYKYSASVKNDTSNFESFKATSEYNIIMKKYESQRWMIFGEGSVFMLLLVLGTMQLFRTFNKEMLLANQQNNFLLSITHELKSPISSIKLALQTISKRANLEEKYQRLVSNAVEDTDRLQSLVDNILFAARMENRSYSFERKEENISELIIYLIEKFKLNTGKTRNIHASIQPDIIYKADKEAFQSALINLFENAFKYSDTNTLIQIYLFRKDRHIVFEVKDEGIGIPLEEREKILQKFYRIGNEETRNTKGTGLGLFIVKKVIESHEGKIVIEDNQPKGAVFRIIFPENSNVKTKQQNT